MQLAEILLVAGGFILGSIIGVLAFLLQRRIQTQIGRTRLLIGLALLAFLVTFLAGGMLLSLSGASITQCETLLDFARCTNLLDLEGVRMELWLRALLPSFLQGACMLGNREACTIIVTNPTLIVSDAGSYAALWISSLLASGVAIFLTRLANRTGAANAERR
jgi:hypothetical protein